MHRFHPVGLVLGLAFFAWSMSPSLLPRPWYLQGVATGLSFATGYAVGCVLAWIVHRCGVHPDWSAKWRRIGWWTIAGLAVVVVPTFLVLGSWWQQIVRELVGADPNARANYLLVLLLAAALFALLVALVRCTRYLSNRLTAFGGRWVPGSVARLASVVVLAAVVLFFVTGTPYRAVVSRLDDSFAAADHGTKDGIVAPTVPERSGSPASGESFASLGREGRTFVGSGPSGADIAALTGRPAREPVRVYAGRDSGGTVEEIADNVVAELDRTDAWSRAELAVVTTTGRGWVNENLAQGLEFVSGGDSAIASMQYSYLPSPMAFLADRETPQHAGRALFEAVFARWNEMPPDARPRLLVFGESLGSFGGQAAFAGEQDMLARTQGGIWTGTPNFTEQWARITDARDPGSPERLPVVDGGRDVRFVADPTDLARGDQPWGQRRIVYWQHASDPIVWWSPDLILHAPDWLREPLGADVDPGMEWIPFVTFWQVTLDMVFSAAVPPGHGHNYGPDAVDLWAEILQNPAWTDAQTQAVRDHLAGDPE
nr:alpha/beta hydrolase [Rhodococcus sp. HNM0569]